MFLQDCIKLIKANQLSRLSLANVKENLVIINNNLSDHMNDIVDISIMQDQSGRIVSADSLGIIKIWDPNTFLCTKSFKSNNGDSLIGATTVLEDKILTLSYRSHKKWPKTNYDTTVHHYEFQVWDTNGQLIKGWSHEYESDPLDSNQLIGAVNDNVVGLLLKRTGYLTLWDAKRGGRVAGISCTYYGSGSIYDIVFLPPANIIVGLYEPAKTHPDRSVSEANWEIGIAKSFDKQRRDDSLTKITEGSGEGPQLVPLKTGKLALFYQNRGQIWDIDNLIAEKSIATILPPIIINSDCLKGSDNSKVLWIKDAYNPYSPYAIDNDYKRAALAVLGEKIGNNLFVLPSGNIVTSKRKSIILSSIESRPLSSKLGLSEILHALTSNTTIRMIDFNKRELDQAGWSLLFSALRKNSCLETLDLRSTGLNNNLCTQLVNSLHPNLRTTLTSLRLEGNNLSRKIIKQTIDFLVNTSVSSDISDEQFKEMEDFAATILESVERGNLENLKQLLSQKTGDDLDEAYKICFEAVTKFGNLAILEWLITNYKDMSEFSERYRQVNNTGLTFFQMAKKNRQLDIVFFLLTNKICLSRDDLSEFYQEWDFSATYLHDEGLPHLVNYRETAYKSLGNKNVMSTILNLSKTQITDKGITYLIRNIDKLHATQINLEGTAVSSRMKSRLKHALAKGAQLNKNQKNIATTKSGSSDISIPEEYKCPLTLQIMFDPVIAADSNTYEREAIEKWLKGHTTSPLTNDPLPMNILIPNKGIKQLIENFLTQNPAIIKNDEVYISTQIKADLINLFKEGNRTKEIDRLIEKDNRFLTMDFGEGTTLLHLACTYGPLELLNRILNRLDDTIFDLLPSEENGRVFFELAAEHLGVEGATLVSAALAWDVEDYQHTANHAIEKNKPSLLDACIDLGINIHSDTMLTLFIKHLINENQQLKKQVLKNCPDTQTNTSRSQAAYSTFFHTGGSQSSRDFRSQEETNSPQNN